MTRMLSFGVLNICVVCCGQERGVLITSTDNPYHTSTPEFIIGSRNSDGLLTSFVFGNDIFVSRSAASDEEQVVLGEYRRCPIDNDWHIGHIVQVPPGPEGSNGARLQWINRAGVSWDLFLDADKGVLKTGDGNPYHESYSEFRLRKRDGEIIGFMFGGALVLLLNRPCAHFRFSKDIQHLFICLSQATFLYRQITKQYSRCPAVASKDTYPCDSRGTKMVMSLIAQVLDMVHHFM